MKHALLGTASALALALYPLSSAAQTSVQDQVIFDRYDTRVDMASAYTDVLLEAHGQVRNYINATARAIRSGARAGDSAAQEAYVLAIARSIEQTGQPPAQGSGYELARYPYAQMGTFNVAFRYCGGNLVTFFDTNTFKSSLTPEQIQNAPRLQAIREGRDSAPRLLYRLQTADDGTRFLADGLGNQRRYDSCIDELNGVSAPLPDNTLLTFARAAVPFEQVNTRIIRTELEQRQCDAGDVGPGRKFKRDILQPLDAAGKPIGASYPGPWTQVGIFCNQAQVIKRFQLNQCSVGSGIARYAYYLVQAQDPDNVGKTIMVPSDEHGTPVASLQLYRDVGTCYDEYPQDVTIDPVRDQSTQETRALACNSVYPGWNGQLVGSYTQARTRRERVFELEHQVGLDDIRQVIYSPWAATSDNCRRISYTSRSEYRTLNCYTGYRGTWRQVRSFRTTHTNYANPGFRDTAVEQLWSGWNNVTYTCTLIPPPPPPSPPSAGGEGGPQGSFDVNGDGVGDYSSPGEASAAGYANSESVDTNCGSCNGPSKGGDGGGGGGGGDKIVCTAMNAAYGFGSYRQAIWLAHAARNMTPYHQTGYHLLAMPLIRTAYGSDTNAARAIRFSIEYMARARTADIRAQMRGLKRHTPGRIIRAILEPLCYIRGWAAGGRSVEEIKEVPVIAAALRARLQQTKGQIHV